MGNPQVPVLFLVVPVRAVRQDLCQRRIPFQVLPHIQVPVSVPSVSVAVVRELSVAVVRELSVAVVRELSVAA